MSVEPHKHLQGCIREGDRLVDVDIEFIRDAEYITPVLVISQYAGLFSFPLSLMANV